MTGEADIGRAILARQTALDPGAQFALLSEAFDAVTLLRSATEAAHAYVARERLADT